jgi:hypothetical protein
VTGDSGIVTEDSGIVTGDSGQGRKSVTFDRNWRSRWTGMAGHDRPECAVTLGRNTHLYAPYPGVRAEEPLARRRTEAIVGAETMELVLHADWDGLDAWMGRNAELRDKRLRHVRGETVLMIWLDGLYRHRTQKARILELGPIEEVAPLANALARNLREAVLRVVEKWPKLINIADFKKQTPLLLATRHGDAAMVDVLLQAGADAEWRDWQGNSAMDLALASGVSLCVEALHTRGRFEADMG